jgi:hypothetical protein
MTSFQLDYLILTFISSLGAIQIGASIGLFTRLLIIQNSRLSLLSGLALLVGAFSWFFISDYRNLNDTEGGLNATGQITFLSLGASSALLATLLIASLAAIRNAIKSFNIKGVEALKTSPLYNALAQRLQRAYRLRYRSYGRNYK